MSQFSRRARWLNVIFPASQAPQKADPHSFSDDVSLVQPYDGSGWPILDMGNGWTREESTPAGISSFVELLPAISRNEIARILACGVQLTAGAAATTLIATVSPDTNLEIPITLITTTHATLQRPLEIACPIIGPGQALRARHSDGDALTVVRFTLLLVVAPLGTVFYV